MKKSQKAYLPFKRLIDLCGSAFGIIMCFIFVWWWLVIVNAIATKGHPFFLSERIGRNGKPFKLIKFRSMKLDADPTMSSINKKSKDELTRFGRYLRRSSLDETTQLFNIFIGQMSFIGPRPLINNAEDGITIALRRENGSISLKPGISGYAQIHGRATLDPKVKAEYDFYYYQNISFKFDAQIFMKSLFGQAYWGE